MSNNEYFAEFYIDLDLIDIETRDSLLRLSEQEKPEFKELIAILDKEPVDEWNVEDLIMEIRGISLIEYNSLKIEITSNVRFSLVWLNDKFIDSLEYGLAGSYIGEDYKFKEEESC